jgi:long-chain fatty acid transport protein
MTAVTRCSIATVLGRTTLAAAAALLPATALAGGFEIPDTGARAVGRGGAFVVGATDPTALYYNPGLLAKQRGTSVLLNNNMVFHDTRFQRATLSDVWGADAGTTFEEARDKQKLFPLGPFFAVASDFGLDNWTFAAGVYGPSAVGKHDYQAYGGQSFMLTDMNILLAYYSLAAAWKHKDVFGIGATLQYVDMISMKYSLVTDSTVVPTLQPVPDADSTQLNTELNLEDRFSGTAIIGGWYRPHPRVELGLASRVVPIFLRAKGGLTTDKETLLSDDVKVELPMTLPAMVRGGVRYIHDKGDREMPWFDLELAAHYENWSAIKAFDLKFDGQISGMPIQDLSIQKNWRDTVSLRLGSDVNVLPKYLTVRAGGFWESAAMRENFSHLDFPSFMRGGISGGVTGGYKGIYLTVGYMHIFQQTREVSEASGKQFQERPLRPCPEFCDGASGVPANAGRFTSRFDILSLGIDIRFRELLAGRRERRRGAFPNNRPGSENGKPAESTTPASTPPASAPSPTTEPAPPDEPAEATPPPADPLEPDPADDADDDTEPPSDDAEPALTAEDDA